MGSAGTRFLTRLFITVTSFREGVLRGRGSKPVNSLVFALAALHGRLCVSSHYVTGVTHAKDAATLLTDLG